MENLYSTIFIVDISQNPDEVDTVASRIQQLIEDHGGVIKKIDRWGKQRLAYPIRKKTHGFYVEIEFSANSHLNIPQILEEEYRLNDRVLRYLTYVIEKKELLQRERNAKRMRGRAAAAAASQPAAVEKKEAAPVAEPKPAPAEAAPVAKEIPASETPEPTEAPAAAPTKEEEAAPATETETETIEKKEDES